MKKTKRIQARDDHIDFTRSYTLQEAVELLKARATAKFDETMEVAFNCNLDPRKGDQNVRSMVSLPFGTGKTMRIAVFAQGQAAQEAEAAGADFVGADDLIERVKGGWMEFDVCIATPDFMPKIGKLGKILGPRDLMPNPKLGTVTQDVAKAVARAKAGQVSVRVDKAGIIHTIIGKASFSVDHLVRNFSVLYDEIFKMRPAALKGGYIKKISLSSTMGFSLPLLLEKERVQGLVF